MLFYSTQNYATSSFHKIWVKKNTNIFTDKKGLIGFTYAREWNSGIFQYSFTVQFDILWLQGWIDGKSNVRKGCKKVWGHKIRKPKREMTTNPHKTKKNYF